MAKGIIRFCYRKIIDASSRKAWDKMVFEDTHREFFMQAQFYNQEKKYNTFAEIIQNIPAAEKLHFLVSTAAIGYLQQLNEQIPDIASVHGKLYLTFKNFKFEIIHSNIHNITEHKIAIYFYSEPYIWIESVDNQLVIANTDQKEILENGGEVQTEMLTLQPFLSISSFQKI